MMWAQASVWLLAAAMGQAPAEAPPAWLKAVPAEADVVVRCRGIASASDDLKAMLNAASPNAAATAVPMIDQFVDQWKGQYGADVVDAPVVGLLRGEAPGPDGVPPFAILVMKDDAKGVLKALAGGKDVATKAEEGGYESFASPFGAGSWYAVDGDGFTAFGPDEALIAGVAKPGDKSLAASLTPALATPFLAGDLGVYVNAARLAERYGEQIDQARQALMATLDQAANNAPNGASMDTIKEMYAGMFDSLKTARSLALNLDFAAEGLRIAGRFEMKPAAGAKPVEAVEELPAEFARLAPDAAFYIYMNMSADTVQQWQGMSLRMLNPTGEGSPAMARVMERFKTLGRIKTFGTSTMAGGMRTFNVTEASDPKVYLEAIEATFQAMKDADSPFNLYKEVEVERDAKVHGGVNFTRITATFDVDKIAKLGQGGGADQIKAMLGGDSMSYWTGVDGRRVIQVTAPTWEEAEARLNQFAKGDSTVGSLAGFRQVRSELADRASFLAIVNGQGITRMMAAQMAATTNRPDLKEPAGLPAEPAFFGVSATPDGPGAYDFRASLPSAMGPVVENGLIPVFRNAQPRPPAVAPTRTPPPATAPAPPSR
ncbi:hypothetical protein [Paludisphaera sp.]|uniref:hypothetical protein n=1 Tax=Paludisphaera sp. TaxID=2017432 RepID=UPI00301CE4E6